jgi:outer membrane lipoprotein-sorting protein
MKRRFMLSVSMAFMTISLISAQDLEEVLKNHFEAIGQKNLKGVKTLQATGNAVMMGMNNPFKMIIHRPDKVRISVEFQGSQIIQAYDGHIAWMQNPMMGSSAPVVVSEAEAAGLIEASDIDGQLWKYKEKGHQLELNGSGDVDGKACYVLKLTKKSGKSDFYYLDKESYHILKLTTSTMMNGSETPVEVLMSNYKAIDGYMMAFNTEQKIGGQAFMTILFDEVKTNVEVDDEIFSKPE